MPEAPVLLVKTHAFGDSMLCTPVVKTLMEEKKSTYWILTGPSAATVWDRIPGIDRIFTAPVPPSSRSMYSGFLKWTIRNRKYLRDVTKSFVFQGSPAVRRWVRYLTAAPMRSSGGSALGNWEEVFPMNETDYAGYSYSKTAGIRPSDWRPLFNLREKEREWVDKLGISGLYFAIAPGGGRNPRDVVLEKRWQPEKYADIANRLGKMGISVLLVGGMGDCDAADEMISMVTSSVLNMTGKTTWGQTAALLDRCIGFLGADSGTAHLAVARKLPSVVLFGPTSPDTLYAKGLITPVVSDVPCSPCYSNSLFPGCTQKSAICMKSLGVEDTWFMIQKLLHENYSG